MPFTEKPPLNELYHYGTKRHSGRYPWGSGDDPYQHSGDFVARIDGLRKEGKSEKEIAEMFKMSTTDLRKEYTTANNERRRLEIDRIKSLKEKGYSNYKIGEIMGLSESSVRSKLNPHTEAKLQKSKETYEFLKKQVAEKGYIDVGKDVEKELGISKTKFDEALYMMEMDGYKVYDRYIDQATNPGKQTTYKVLCPIDTDIKTFLAVDPENIKSVGEYKTENDGETFRKKFEYPKSMDSSRLQIRYADDVGPDGVKGIEKDGIIELRRGVDDLSLGNSRYSQVRILVDNDRYLKGVAVYSDNMPDGVDVIFNTNKSKDVPMREVLKEIKKDPDNPFGSSIKDANQGGQYHYIDKNGKEQLGLINKRSDEGDWADWSNNLPSQFLSKQPYALAKKQIDLAIDQRQKEYDEICSLTNPTVKKKLLQDFAEGCDSAAVHLKAAALPRQQYHVIIPINSLKGDGDKGNEIYAPNYKDGEQVALIRYPHGGTFEIPICTVNNKNATAKKLLGSDVVDAVGINHKVAERLSGADFDGDTVMVIPISNKVNIKSTPSLDGLKNFDPKMEYATVKKDGKYYNSQGVEVKIMKNTGNEMGRISNLITDMTLIGAPNSELERAVKHSMVVIDAEKHKLDYKQSEIDNDIATLKKRYQRSYDEETGEKIGGASTLISRSKSQASVEKRQGTPKINSKYKSNGDPNPDYDPSKPEGALLYKKADDLYYADRIRDKKNPNITGFRLADGKKVTYDVNDKEAADYYRPVKKVDEKTGEVYFTNKTGEYRYKTATRMQKSTKMMETDDARTLISSDNNKMENLYADYANKMKYLANQARREYVYTTEIDYSPTAKNTYLNEVNSLDYKLTEAQKNSPRERRAQALANSRITSKQQDNPDMSKGELKKLKQQELERAREEVGAKRRKIEISDKEWEAIQAGAISKTKLQDILKYADMDIVRTKAMPSTKKTLSTAQQNRIKSMLASGRYTTAEIADALGVSTSTVNLYSKGKE